MRRNKDVITGELPDMFKCFIPMLPDSRQETGRILPVKRGGKTVYVSVKSKKLRGNQELLATFIGQWRKDNATIDVPFSVGMLFVYPYLQRHWKIVNKMDSFPLFFKDTRPDIDNVTKNIMDVLAACGVFSNDAKCVETSIAKVHGNNPGSYICVIPATPDYLVTYQERIDWWNGKE